MSFQRVEVQWDAGVAKPGAVPQPSSSHFLFSELSRGRPLPLVADLRFQVCPHTGCRLLLARRGRLDSWLPNGKNL